MLLIFLAIIAMVFVSVFLLIIGDRRENGFLLVGGFFGSIGAVACALIFATQGWLYVSAAYQADIVNREYKTNYTQAEIFFASNVIETIRQLDRKRVEVNGDLLRDKK